MVHGENDWWYDSEEEGQESLEHSAKGDKALCQNRRATTARRRHVRAKEMRKTRRKRKIDKGRKGKHQVQRSEGVIKIFLGGNGPLSVPAYVRQRRRIVHAATII